MTLATAFSLAAMPACGSAVTSDDGTLGAQGEQARAPGPSGGGPGAPTAPTAPTAPDADPVPDGGSPLLLPATPHDYAGASLPASFQAPFVQAQDNTPAANPLTNDGATLGRVLFYDKGLSANRTIACASCHQQGSGFSDTAPLSRGFAGELTARNSMPISNARYYRSGRFFWDERAATLEAQVLMPIQSPVEMGLSLSEAVDRVAAQPYYAALFARAFGSAEITSDRIARALAQFVRSIVSYRSRYDQGLAQAGTVGAPFPGFSAQENRGKAIFLGPGGCAACHLVNPPPPPGQPPGPRQNDAVFFVNVATNNGLAADLSGDQGVGAITGRPGDMGRFKSPELRNVALTAPYMHDGSLATLEQVVDHYDAGVQPHPNLDPRLRVPGTTTPRRLNLSAADKAALVAFLRTLTDEALARDPRFASPFRE